LVFTAFGWCGETPGRAGIEKVIAALNEPGNWTGARPSFHLVTSDADLEFDRLSNVVHQMLELSKKPWSEVTTPRFAVRSIRFVTPDVAVADAAVTQYGSVILVRRVPVLFVMKKEGTHWRIDCLRVLIGLANASVDP